MTEDERAKALDVAIRQVVSLATGCDAILSQLQLLRGDKPPEQRTPQVDAPRTGKKGASAGQSDKTPEESVLDQPRFGRASPPQMPESHDQAADHT